ncbi:MAG: protease [Bacillus thermozeamaize]|uniref:Protease n=1 Tax=Bacillus thermozeamaize TaxID=230954 RepID=A0A1Y3PNQ3_9BACI|nr:MAG: protease [Bacillus thermozeamaize]
MARIAFLVAQEYEDSELSYPYEELKKDGHECVIISFQKGEELRGKKGQAVYKADAAISEVRPEDFDAVVIPGGFSPDRLRIDEGMKRFVQQKMEANQPVAAICHGPQLLISAKVVKGKEMTCYKSVMDDLENAGAKVVDRPVVVDGNLITSRMPQDNEVFVDAIRKALSQ